MKIKPAQRNALKAMVEEAERDIARLQGTMAKFQPGTSTYQGLKLQLEKAREQHRNAELRLARTTQPN
ncbi:hypothetical protein V0M98_33685 (plasmid) [Pseudomonas silesiensis]|uniref:hypothetical protein n=1 Tax=Pseudomonas silesiensis TaxID=1853130 RepID=UPI0030D5A5E3